MNGNQLDTIREAMGVTKVRLAEELKMSRPTLDTRLSDPSTFTLGELDTLCRILKIEKSSLLTN